MLNHTLQEWWKHYFIGFYYRGKVFEVDLRVQWPINQSRPFFYLSTMVIRKRLDTTIPFKYRKACIIHLSETLTLINLLQSLATTLKFLLQNASRYLNKIFCKWDQQPLAQIWPELNQLQLRMTFTLHIMHLCLLGNLTWHLILVTSLFFLPTATCCCQPKSV